MAAISNSFLKEVYNRPEFLSFSNAIQEKRREGEYLNLRSRCKIQGIPHHYFFVPIDHSHRIMLDSFGGTSTERNSNVLSNFDASSFSDDAIQLIMWECLRNIRMEDLLAFARTSKKYYISREKIFKRAHITQLCPGLSIMNAKKLTSYVGDFSESQRDQIIKCFWRVVKHVENREGLTLICEAQGLTYYWLVEEAKKVGITIDCPEFGLRYSYGNLPRSDQEDLVLVSNAPVNGTRNKKRIVQEKIVRWIGFDGTPSLMDYLLVSVFAQKISNLKTCLFRTACFSSSEYGYGSVMVGNSTLGKIPVRRSYDSDPVNPGDSAGGAIRIKTDK